MIYYDLFKLYDIGFLRYVLMVLYHLFLFALAFMGFIDLSRYFSYFDFSNGVGFVND